MKDKKLKEIMQAIINDLKHKKEALAIPETNHIFDDIINLLPTVYNKIEKLEEKWFVEEENVDTLTAKLSTFKTKININSKDYEESKKKREGQKSQKDKMKDTLNSIGEFGNEFAEYLDMIFDDKLINKKKLYKGLSLKAKMYEDGIHFDDSLIQFNLMLIELLNLHWSSYYYHTEDEQQKAHFKSLAQTLLGFIPVLSIPLALKTELENQLKILVNFHFIQTGEEMKLIREYGITLKPINPLLESLFKIYKDLKKIKNKSLLDSLQQELSMIENLYKT